MTSLFTPAMDEGGTWDESRDSAEAAAAEEALLERKKQKARKRPKKPWEVGIRITDRDLHLLQFLTRYRYATYPQIADYLDTSVNAMRLRLPRLAKAGLVTGDNGGATSLLVWRPTETGVRLSGMDLPTPNLSWGSVHHTLGLVELGVQFEKVGEVVVTEREIRAAENRKAATERMGFAYGHHSKWGEHDEAGEAVATFTASLGSGKGRYTHIPDMVLVRAPGPDGAPLSLAVELELNRKTVDRWRRVLLAYRKSRTLGGVVYYTHRAAIRRGILNVARSLNMEDMVRVQEFTPPEGSKLVVPQGPAA